MIMILHSVVGLGAPCDVAMTQTWLVSPLSDSDILVGHGNCGNDKFLESSRTPHTWLLGVKLGV